MKLKRETCYRVVTRSGDEFLTRDKVRAGKIVRKFGGHVLVGTLDVTGVCIAAAWWARGNKKILSERR